MSLLKDKQFLHSSLVLSDLCCFFVVEHQRGPDNRGATSGSPPKLYCTEEGAPSIQIPYRWHHPGQYSLLESELCIAIHAFNRQGEQSTYTSIRVAEFS